MRPRHCGRPRTSTPLAGSHRTRARPPAGRVTTAPATYGPTHRRFPKWSSARPANGALPTTIQAPGGRHERPRAAAPSARQQPHLGRAPHHIDHRTLLPTPQGRDGKGADPNPNGVDLNQAVALPPTPRATDATKGSLHQHGSSGDLTLTSTVHLLPTPTAGDARSSAIHTVPDAGRPIPRGYVTLTDAARLLPAPSVPDALGGHRSRSASRSEELLLPGVVKSLAASAEPTATQGQRSASSPGRCAPATAASTTPHWPLSAADGSPRSPTPTPTSPPCSRRGCPVYRTSATSTPSTGTASSPSTS